MDKTLKVVEQKTVTFYDDDLIAVRGDDGHVYVSVRHMSEALGLSRQSQVRRINRTEILAEGHKKGATLAPLQQRGTRELNWLRVDLVPLWLTGVQIKNVREEIQLKLKQYQKEAAKVLWEAFQEGRLTADPSFSELLEADSPAAQAYKMLQALTKLARSQLILESKVSDHEQRLEQIEATLGDPGRHVTPDQASQISQSVKTVAMILSKSSGSNQYGSVYGELYRKFGITSYKMLPDNKFDEAMRWLTEWHEQLTQDAPF